MLFSIITVCKNSENTIEDTLLSVSNQTYSNYEYLLIDGESSDQTLQIINSSKNHKWQIYSEKDHGIYDAMNKAINLAKGKYLIFLNAGDIFHGYHVLDNVKTIIEQNQLEDDIIYGDVNLSFREGEGFELRKHNNISKFSLMTQTITHQAIFASRKAFDEAGKFDLKYSITADYDWLLKCYFNSSLSFKYIPLIVCNYLGCGISEQKKDQARIERKLIRAKYIKNKFLFKIIKKFEIQQYVKGNNMEKLIFRYS